MRVSSWRESTSKQACYPSSSSGFHLKEMVILAAAGGCCEGWKLSLPEHGQRDAARGAIPRSYFQPLYELTSHTRLRSNRAFTESLSDNLHHSQPINHKLRMTALKSSHDLSENLQ